MLAERLAQIEDRIAAACRRGGRARSDVTLVAVTKSTTPEIAAGITDLGVQHLGESRPQELWRKAALVPGARWHLIGNLQRNKIERTMPLVELIHSVNSLRLLQALESTAEAQDRKIDILLEINASGEGTKQGLLPDELVELIHPLTQVKHLHLRGLMTMAAPEDDPERCRPTFVTLRTLRDNLARELEPLHTLDHLSMGMSNDFEIAIEEGATLIRLGSILFEGLS